MARCFQEKPEEQCTSKHLFVHWILQFTMLITLRWRLHRCSSQDKKMSMKMTHSLEMDPTCAGHLALRAWVMGSWSLEEASDIRLKNERCWEFSRDTVSRQCTKVCAIQEFHIWQLKTNALNHTCQIYTYGTPTNKVGHAPCFIVPCWCFHHKRMPATLKLPESKGSENSSTQWSALCVRTGHFARLLPSSEVVAVSQATSPESNPNFLSPVTVIVGQYPTIESGQVRNLEDSSPQAISNSSGIIKNTTEGGRKRSACVVFDVMWRGSWSCFCSSLFLFFLSDML